MTAKKSKSINRDDIRIAIIDNRYVEILYDNVCYDGYMLRSQPDWQAYYSEITTFSAEAKELFGIDKLLYSDLIDSFLKYYNS